MSEEKKIIIDEDWKSQVEAEKEAAAHEPGEAAPSAETPSADPEDPPMPPATMQTLVSTLATEALVALGQIPHPATEQLQPSRNQAQYFINTIEMLKEKTEGNIPAEETTAIESLLHQLRMAFVQMPG